jgi:DNA-binding LytR/AlgR family response regulator
MALADECPVTSDALRVAVAEDEPMNLKRLVRLLESEKCEVVAVFEDGDAVLQWAQARPDVDALFLDIRMPGASGLDVLRALDPPLPVVFVTAHAEHAVEAFDQAAADYLLKPVTAQRLEKCLDRLRARTAPPPGHERPREGRPARYAVKAGEGVVFLDLAKTSHFEVVAGVVWAHAAGRFQTLWKTLTEAEAALPGRGLMRLHRHLLVRPEIILGVKPLWGGRLLVTLPGGVELESSRGAVPKLKERLGLL